jgi:hypothetical protein
LFLKIKRNFETRNVNFLASKEAQVVQHLPSKYEALISNPSAAKKDQA